MGPQAARPHHISCIAVRTPELLYVKTTFDEIPFPFSHATEVMETADWKRLVQSHSNIVADAFKALASLKASPPIWGPPKKKQKPG